MLQRLSVSLLGPFVAVLLLPMLAFARGGGGCLEEGTPVLTSSGWVSIESLKPGDEVLSVSQDKLESAQVLSLVRVDPSTFFEVTAQSSSGRKISVRFTAEHPVAIASGKFLEARLLTAGAEIVLLTGGSIEKAVVTSVSEIRAEHPAYNLLVAPGGTFSAGGILVHNKGCFLPSTPITLADGSEKAIEEIQPGDAVLAFDGSGSIVSATVRNILSRRTRGYLIVQTSNRRLEVTPEHPFLVGPGEFENAEQLNPGDRIFVLAESTLRPERIESIDRIDAEVTVYNLQTDKPHTFFAHGTAVHNKGGGCFAAGTLIDTPGGQVAIEELRPGDEVSTLTPKGLSTGKIEATHRALDDLYSVRLADHSELLVTSEHPLLTERGEFEQLSSLEPGRLLFAPQRGFQKILAIEKFETAARVYNLTVGGAHTFLANGIAVHNKGGGFRGGHSHGGGRPMTPQEQRVALVLFVLIGGGYIIWLVYFQEGWRTGELDYVFTPAQIEPKARKTEKLLQFIAQQDPIMNPADMSARAKFIFETLQHCWQARSYDPMRELLMPDLYRQHVAQLSGMRRNHEINRIESLSIEKLRLVNVRYTSKVEQREFTALITASARDYYVDDRDNSFLRGDSFPQQFQEFWVFQLQDGKWLLREIEQTMESRALKEENFFEQFTDRQIEQVLGENSERTGALGPTISSSQAVRVTKTERLLNFLVQTDPAWNQEVIQDRARHVFSTMILSMEAGVCDAETEALLSLDLAKQFKQQLASWAQDGFSVQFRNFCVRKVEIVLVRNFADVSKDECVLRVTYHAQEIWMKGDGVVRADPYVTGAERYMTLGRRGSDWVLSELVDSSRGQSLSTQENIDEGTSPGQMEWFYSKKRAN